MSGGFASHEFDEVTHAAGIAPFIVIPSGDFNETFIDDVSQRGIDGGGVGIVPFRSIETMGASE